jgi:hypothetical protein
MPMGAIEVVLDILAAQPWSVRSRFIVRRESRHATVQRGALHASIRELDGGAVEVIYEHALHAVTRERVAPEVAAQLLLAVLQRERLMRVEVPGAEPAP